MSTILRALKKSQQERDRGTVPTLTRAPELAATPKARFWAWWAGGVLALNAAVLAILVWWLDASPDSGEAAAKAASAELAPAPAPPEVSRTDPQASPGPTSDGPGGLADPRLAPPRTRQVGLAAPEPDPEPEPDPTPRNPPAVVSAPVSAAAVEPETDGGASPASRSPPRPTPKAHPAQAPRTAVENPALAPARPAPVASQSLANLPDPRPARVAPLVVAPAKAPPRAPTPEPAPKVLDPDPYASLPVLFQLPHEIQRAIPDLPITVHVYDKDPGYRFVVMRRRKYREGDQLGQDLILEAIAPGGLVLRYQGTAFWLDF